MPGRGLTHANLHPVKYTKDISQCNPMRIPRLCESTSFPDGTLKVNATTAESNFSCSCLQFTALCFGTVIGPHRLWSIKRIELTSVACVAYTSTSHGPIRHSRTSFVGVVRPACAMQGIALEGTTVCCHPITSSNMTRQTLIMSSMRSHKPSLAGRYMAHKS